MQKMFLHIVKIKKGNAKEIMEKHPAGEIIRKNI